MSNTFKGFIGLCCLSISLSIQAIPTDVIHINEFESYGITDAEAARFLNQATFGASRESIAEVKSGGYHNWILKQYGLAETSHREYLETARLNGISIYQNIRSEAWADISTTGIDQLRQRMAFALSQIWVISDLNGLIDAQSMATASYYDMLAQAGTGNYRDLMQDATLNVLMGHYLSMFQNQKPDPANNIRADENYAREIMQLFTIGLVQLNPDGTPQTDGQGQHIPTYDQNDIMGLARVLTGWNMAGTDVGGNGFCETWEWTWPTDQYDMPMEACENYHDTDPKTILDNFDMPGGQTAQQDLDMALDHLFTHPNIGPFIGKQLIQRMVTSNPTTAYVQRVAEVFDDNGSGVRGDMASVFYAVLMDDEARNGHLYNPDQFGKLREPLIRQTHLWRAFSAIPEAFGFYRDWFPEEVFAQSPLRAPSVFNFYRPDYSQPGPIQNAGLVSPEFQILTASFATSTINRYWNLSYYQWNNGNVDWINWQTGVILDLDYERSIANDVNALLDHLDIVLMSGSMSATMRSTLSSYLNTIPYTGENQWSPDGSLRAMEAIYFILVSPEYAIQR